MNPARKKHLGNLGSKCDGPMDGGIYPPEICFAGSRETQAGQESWRVEMKRTTNANLGRWVWLRLATLWSGVCENRRCFSSSMEDTFKSQVQILTRIGEEKGFWIPGRNEMHDCQVTATLGTKSSRSRSLSCRVCLRVCMNPDAAL